MTTLLSGQEVASKLAARFPESVIESNNFAVTLKTEYLLEIADYLKNSPEEAYDFLADITSVDYLDYFEIVYRLTSIKNNRSLVFKVRCPDREKPSVPSLTGLWKGADLMEREVFDMMGISFDDHPNMKRIFLWEGFKGYPLRKDYL
jgi:NADH-quinone oxidoreductase subunit C